MVEFDRAITKSEIEEAIRGKGDFVKIDYLKRYLEVVDSLEVKKFVLLNLAGICEANGMFGEAAKNMAVAADICLTYREKIEFFMKEAELLVKFGNFDLAEKAFERAYALGNSQEKINVKNKYHEFYRIQGELEEQQGKNRKALEVYERLLPMIENETLKLHVKEKMLELYQKLGRMKEYEELREGV